MRLECVGKDLTVYCVFVLPYCVSVCANLSSLRKKLCHMLSIIPFLHLFFSMLVIGLSSY